MKIIGRILLGLLGFVGLILIIVVAIWMNPGVILTQSRVDHYFNQYASPYFSKMPEHLELNLDEHGFTGKRVRIVLTPFCLKDPEACFKVVHLEFAFNFVSFTKVKIDEVGPIEVINESFIMRSEKKKKTEPESPKKESHLADHLTIPTDLRIKDIMIEFPKFEIVNKDTITGHLQIHGKETDKLNIVAGATGPGLKAAANINSSFLLNQNNPFQAKLSYEGKGQVNADIHGAVNWNSLRGKLEGDVVVHKFIPWVDTLTVKNLVIDREDKITVKSDLEAKLEPKLDEHNKDSALPKASFNPLLHGKFEAVETNDSHIDYKIHMGPLHEKGVELETRVAGVYPFPKGEEYHYGLKEFLFRLELPKFQTFVNNLKNTNSAVPAPFASMGGSIKLEVGNADAHFKDTLPILFTTNLDSKEQTMKTESKGTVVFAQAPEKMKIDGQTLIQSFRFTMPDLDILAPPPALKNDARIISTHQKPPPPPLKKEDLKVEVAQNKAQESSVDLNWKIRTAPSGIQVYYPVLKPYAPIEVKWDLTKDKSGEVKLLPFTIEFLNRKARVKSLRYYINPGDPAFHYEGQIVVPKTEYTIFIDIIQDGTKPKIKMTSDPPLPESDIVSVLLFNQTSAELDSADTTSVASTQSAIANRALGIFTILTLSSTPIEAVNFNPSTGIYSARIKLAKGLTATVGTDWDKSQEVALRKRLGRNFVLSTVFQTDQQTNEQTTRTLIEWFRRY